MTVCVCVCVDHLNVAFSFQFKAKEVNRVNSTLKNIEEDSRQKEEQISHLKSRLINSVSSQRHEERWKPDVIHCSRINVQI